MSAPISAQGKLSLTQEDIFLCPQGQRAFITSITFSNPSEPYSLSLSRAILKPDPVIPKPIVVDIYTKYLNAGDTVFDKNGYALLGGNSIRASSNKENTTYVIDGYTEANT